MSYFTQVKELVKLDIDDDLLCRIIFEMSRFFDNKVTKLTQKYQKANNVVISSPDRKLVRKKYYYGKYFKNNIKYDIGACEFSDEDIETASQDCFHRLTTYDASKIIDSMKQKVHDLEHSIVSDDNMQSWLKYYEERRKNKKYSFVSIKLDQDLFEKSGYNENILTDFILNTYDDLENYRYLAIVVSGEIFNKKKECITWKLMYKAGIYAENFVQYKEKYFPFHKDKQIANLAEFLSERGITDNSIAANFYENISTGYKFEDCYVSDNQDCKIMLYKKIELDQSNVPCPSCNTTIQSGNSYPEMFLRSWECKNPSCRDRSKSGRGKRFDEYGSYRYFKLVENDPNNVIDEALYQNFRRDIFAHNNDWKEFLIKEYTYGGEKIFFENITTNKLFGRKLVKYEGQHPAKNAISDYESLPIVKLYDNILSAAKFKTGDRILEDSISAINADSSEFIQTLKPGQIGSAITSPPYYNAREYSQWGTLLMYFADMLINAKVIYDSLKEGAYYLYNIGDIVSEDNIYVVSNMSKHRVQLGFLSSMIFEIAGYNLTGNILWDKGEVQSKRNSTVNLVSGYVKCINCYEHVLVFRKGKFEKVSNSILQLTPVIKINSKGENKYGHTAPYPIDLVNLLQDYVDKDSYVLDPFLGSGTTLKWCKNNGYKGVGIELNDVYFNLCLENIGHNK